METEIDEKRLEELEDIEMKMLALEGGGLDNWEGYDISLESYFKQKEERERMSNVIDEVVDALCEGVEEPAGSGCGFGVRPECIKNAIKILTGFMAS